MSTPASTSNTFEYSKRTYTVVATLTSSNSSKDNDVNISLDPIDIEEIMYESKLNDLLVTGHVIYTDKYAQIDKMLNQHFGYFELLFALNKNQNDDQVGIGEIDEENAFRHTFIISNIKVLARSYTLVKYEIDLVSTNWFKCISNIQYSNYADGPQPIFKVIKDCLALNELQIDDESFGKVNVPVNINYTTQLNDNTFTVMDYLFHKLYYFPTKDNSVKFFLYDLFTDKYRILDLKNKETSTGSFATILSFFKTNNEALIQQEPTNIGSFKNPLPKTTAYVNAFEKQMFFYDYKTDQFGIDKTPPDQTVNYFNNKIDNNDYGLKYQKMFDVANQKFIQYGSYWNNDQDTYNNAVAMLEENNSLVLNITGQIMRQPGSYTVISLDRSMENITTDLPSDIEKLKQKYKAYEGLWIASKVQNIIHPAHPYPSFRQRLALFRNFIPKYTSPS